MQSSVFTKIHNQKKKVQTSLLQQTPWCSGFSLLMWLSETTVYTAGSRHQTALHQQREELALNGPLTTGKDSELRFLQRVNSLMALSDFSGH